MTNMDFFPGTINDSGSSLTIDDGLDGFSVPIRDRDDQPLKLDPGTRVVLYGIYARKRSPRHRRLIVHEVYVQERLA